MPYKSNKQKAYMHAEHPDIAARWDKEAKGQKPHKTKIRSAANKAFGGRY